MAFGPVFGRPRRRVLVVEDDDAVRESLGLVLDQTYDVVFADDGPPALALIRSTAPDVVLLDLGLPSMPGLEVLRQIRRIAPDLPVVIVSITRGAPSVVLAMKLGAADYLTKPFREEDLLARVGAATAPGEAGRAPGRLGAPPTTPSGSQCLLLVGDPGMAATLQLILGRAYTTRTAATGSEGVLALDGIAPDCVVCDDLAWDADGAAFIRVMREQYPGAVVIRVTAADGTSRAGAAGIGPLDTVVEVQAGVGEIVRRVVARCPSTRPPGHGRLPLSDRIADALDLFRRRYPEEIRIEEVAEVVALSRGHLTERFRAELGRSPRQYLLRLRVEVARLLLARHRAKLEQVAALAGFRDASPMSRTFLAATGQRPGAYRRQYAV